MSGIRIRAAIAKAAVGIINGAVIELSLDEIDDLLGIPGYGAALAEAGWLEPRLGGYFLPAVKAQGEAEQEDPEGFARFWAAYPKKVGKGAALKAWKKRKPGKSLVDEILRSVEQHKRCKAWLDGFIPNPATWLNEGRWEDSPDASVAHARPREAEMRDNMKRIEEDRGTPKADPRQIKQMLAKAFRMPKESVNGREEEERAG